MQTVINKGLVKESDFSQKLIFRQMLDLPLGMAYIYLVDKTPEVLEMEMRVLNVDDREAPVFYQSIGKVFPIFWEDDMPEIPVACMNIYELIYTGKFELLSIDEEFRQDHLDLFEIYKKYAQKRDENMGGK